MYKDFRNGFILDKKHKAINDPVIKLKDVFDDAMLMYQLRKYQKNSHPNDMYLEPDDVNDMFLFLINLYCNYFR